MNNENQDLPTQSAPKLPATQAGTVFDIVRPGKVLANPSSRPIIASPKTPNIPDDQLVQQAPAQAAAPVADDAQKQYVSDGSNDGQTMMKHGDRSFTFSAEQTEKDNTPAMTADQLQAAADATDTAPELPPTDQDLPPIPADKLSEENPAFGGSVTAANVSVDLPAEPVESQAAATLPQSQQSAVAPTEHNVVSDTEAPQLSAVVSHHKTKAFRVWHLFLTLFVIIMVAAIVADVLIDMEILKPSFDVPHTTFL